MRFGWILIAPALAACAHVSPKADATPPARSLEESLARLQRKADQIAAGSKVPNAALGIVRGDRLIWFQGFGTRDDKGGAPIDEQTAFRIGSITKTLTAVALLQLRDAGKLSLDDPLSKYIPEAAGVVAPGGGHAPILLRHLVTHTSGLPREVYDWDTASGPSESFLLAALSGMRLDFDPGTDQIYSNYGMALAGIVVARVSGESYRQYMQHHVFEPLQMTHTSFDPEALPAGSVATGHQRDDDKGPYSPIARQLDEGAMEPCGGLYSTVSDLARFAAFELGAWSGGDDAILARSSRLESQAPEPLATPTGGFVGVTWQLANTKIGRQVWHNGSIDGYRAVLTLYPNRGIGVIALTGSDQDATLWKMQDAAVDAVEHFVASPRGWMGERLQETLDRLITFINAPSSDRIPGLFSAGFRKYLVDPNLEAFAERVHAKLGTCPTSIVLTSRGNSQATFWSNCQKWSARIDLAIVPQSGLIDSWSVRWFDD